MERLTMMVSMQMFGIVMNRGRAPTEPEIDEFVRTSLSALKKTAEKAAEVEKIEREADRLRHGGPR